MATPDLRDDIRLRGSRTPEEPGWDEGRVARWVGVFLALGVALRLLRFALNHPLWRDEAYLAWNVLDRDYAGLTKPLDYQQVCPLLFLWIEKAVVQALGFREWSLRLVPTAAAVAGLFVLRHVARRLFRGVAVAIAVAILAVGFTPIRHGGEVKPYATDFLVASSLIGLAVEWLRTPGRVRFLWALAALGPVAVGISNPSIFVAAGVAVVLAGPVLRTRSPRRTVPFAAFGMATAATFLVLLRWVNAPQGESVMPWMRVYWAKAFPPPSPLGLVGWLARAHTSQMFAYPAGGDVGASALTTGLVVAAVAAYLRRGSRTVLALLLAPFAMGLAAAFLGRYPYGGSARTMQYVAPSIILMAGLGAAVLLARLPRPAWRARAPAWALSGLAAVGVGMMARDATHPYMEPIDRDGRDFARRLWAEESSGAELVCARTDLRLPLDPLVWRGDRAAVYLCHQAIYSPRHRAKAPPRLDRVSDTHPLRLVVFGETRGDAEIVARWIAERAGRFTLRSRRVRVLNEGLRRGKALAEDRYVIYELGPLRTGADPHHGRAERARGSSPGADAPGPRIATRTAPLSPGADERWNARTSLVTSMMSPVPGITARCEAEPATIPARGFLMQKKSRARSIRRPRPASLRGEQAVYRAHLRRWVREHDGEHVLIKGHEVVGFFATRGEALAAGYERFGVVPLFVKRVTATEPIDHIPTVIL